MQNAEIARLLGDVADLLEISAGNPFKVRAYRNAARTVADHPDPIAELVSGGEFDLTDLAGIGGGIAKEITALVETGVLPQRQQLIAAIPPGLLDLLRIAGLGPKRVKLFHDELKVNSVADLKAALDAGNVAKLPGFGPKLLEKIREGVAAAASGDGHKRMVLHEAEQYARAIVEYLKAGGGIDEIDVAGSFRRRKETIGDLDIVVTSSKPAAVIERFGKYGEVTHVAAQGDTRSTVRLSSGLQVDLRVVEPSCFGAAMQYFTGSQAHNIELRKIAQAKKLKLNEYGVFRGSSAFRAAPSATCMPHSASTGSRPSCARIAAKSRSRKRTNSRRWSRSTTSAAICRCTLTRATGKPRSQKWWKRPAACATSTSQSPTTHRGRPWPVRRPQKSARNGR